MQQNGNSQHGSRHGGKILVDQLAILGVRRVFSVPGESFLAALDGLYDSGIANIVCRQEGGAAMMAEAHAKLTGETGVLFVTRGPGATNASSGIHVAVQDSTPMVMFVGQIQHRHRDREAFQEVDYRAMFGGMAKWVAEVDDTERLPEYIARAFRVANAGRPGPVVLALPEDMLSDHADVPDMLPPSAPQHADLSGLAAAVMDDLKAAKKPLVIAGGGGWSVEAADALGRFATAQGLPVAIDFRRQGHMDNRHACYAGDLAVGMNPRLAQRMRDADALLVIGSRLGDIETDNYTLLDPLQHGKLLIHVHLDPAVPGRVYQPTRAIAADPAVFLNALAALPEGDKLWQDWTESANADYREWRRPIETPGAVKLEEVVSWLSDNLPADAIVTNGAGNYAAFVHRYFRFTGYGSQLAPTSGSMGYGFPASIAASLECPDKTVVCFAGDGCFQMTCNEMSTAIQHGATPIVIVANNGRYGTIRMHQEKHYPGRTSGTDMANPDFAALARAYGGHGETVVDGAEFAQAFERAKASGLPAVIDLRLDPDMLTPGKSLSATREAALGHS